MPILVRFTNFCDFHDFRKALTTTFFGISNIPTVNFEIKAFSFYLFKNFCSPVTEMCAPRSLRSKLKDFLAMLVRGIYYLFLQGSKGIDLFTKRHKLVHNGRFSKFEV